MKKINIDEVSKKCTLFFYKFEYQILVLSGILCGLLIIYITNTHFVNSKIYYLLFIFGLVVSSLGFLLEYVIKSFKKKAIEGEFSYFLSDLSREYKLAKNMSIALANTTMNNTYGSIDVDIKRIANRVSWGDSFENALKNINANINSPIIKHSLLLLRTLKNSSVPLDKVLNNIAKDINVYKQETQKTKYFNNLYYLSIIFFMIFLFVLVYLNLLIGNKFLWYSSTEIMTRIFFDNFLLYIALLLSFFTAFVMYSIKGVKSTSFIKYVLVFFIIIVVLFQVFIPKPEAEGVLIETIDNLYDTNLSNATLNKIISLKSLSSKAIVDDSKAEMVYFIPLDQQNCGIDCAKYTILVADAVFFNFEINQLENEIFIYYEITK